MKEQNRYVPPSYTPLGGSDQLPDVEPVDEGGPERINSPELWSSGICACCDDMQSCCFGLICPCLLFGKNAEYLGSGTLAGSCMTHFLLWGFLNAVCCFMTDGVLLGLPSCFVAFYACHYRKTLRSKFNLQEAPCGDFATHLFCHLCAVCQEYREICERSGDPRYSDLNSAIVTAPPAQRMDSTEENDNGSGATMTAKLHLERPS